MIGPFRFELHVAPNRLLAVSALSVPKIGHGALPVIDPGQCRAVLWSASCKDGLGNGLVSRNGTGQHRDHDFGEADD